VVVGAAEVAGAVGRTVTGAAAALVGAVVVGAVVGAVVVGGVVVVVAAASGVGLPVSVEQPRLPHESLSRATRNPCRSAATAGATARSP
jgi:hypothetical protein